MSDQFEIHWVSRGTPPKQQPNPAYPDGVPEVDASNGVTPNCVAVLPYPSGHKDVGAWIVKCRLCRLKVGVTAASRPDDPRSVRVPCKIVSAQQ